MPDVPRSEQTITNSFSRAGAHLAQWLPGYTNLLISINIVLVHFASKEIPQLPAL
jgi:hypothetical protein